ncbi:MAG: NUDIX domain-containing protein [Lentisphaerales bacterium]|nr:NUDIX domain-containing protein [Lentisphaerales bacterium]
MQPSVELLDVFDEQENHIGVFPRSQVHAEGLWHKTAQVWLINEFGELLLQLRSPEKDCFPNRWDISSAGHIPAGMKPLDSAIRELKEELGVSKKANELKFLFKHVQPYIGESHIDREIAFVYLVEVPKSQEFILQETEVSAVRWIHTSKLLEDFYRQKADYVDHENHFKKLLQYLAEH